MAKRNRKGRRKKRAHEILKVNPKVKTDLKSESTSGGFLTKAPVYAHLKKLPLYLLSLAVGIFVGQYVSDYRQEEKERDILAHYLAQARSELGDSLYRLQVCSPLGRKDWLKQGIEANELNQFSEKPDFSQLWSLKTNDLCLTKGSERFKSYQLPLIIDHTRSLKDRWPSPGLDDFPYAESYNLLKNFMDTIDVEGAKIIGNQNWTKLSGSFASTTEIALNTSRNQKVSPTRLSKLDVNHLIDEGPLENADFKQMILSVKTPNAIFYIDFLSDRAYKLKAGKYYQYQGNISERNARNGYLPAMFVPENILKFDLLKARGSDNLIDVK